MQNMTSSTVNPMFTIDGRGQRHMAFRVHQGVFSSWKKEQFICIISTPHERSLF